MLNKLWSFLKAEENQKLLGWIGGGLVVLGTGLWAVFTFYVDHSKPPPTTIVEQKGTGIASGRDTNVNAPVTIGANVKADHGGVAIGGNASNNTFITGITPEMLAAFTRPWEELSESQKKEIAKLQGDLDLNSGRSKARWRFWAKPMFRRNAWRRSSSRSPENSRTFKRRRRRNPATIRESLR